MGEISTNVVDMAAWRSTAPSGSGIGTHNVKSSVDTETVSLADRRTSLNDLYGDAIGDTRLINVARRILHECADLMTAAITANLSGERVDADLATSRAFAAWPELFLCRSISDGFGVAVLGIFYAYQNSADDVLSETQMRCILMAIEFLTDNPFLPFDSALTLLEDLEEADLLVDPPEAAALGELLASE